MEHYFQHSLKRYYCAIKIWEGSWMPGALSFERYTASEKSSYMLLAVTLCVAKNVQKYL